MQCTTAPGKDTCALQSRSPPKYSSPAGRKEPILNKSWVKLEQLWQLNWVPASMCDVVVYKLQPRDEEGRTNCKVGMQPGSGLHAQHAQPETRASSRSWSTANISSTCQIQDQGLCCHARQRSSVQCRSPSVPACLAGVSNVPLGRRLQGCSLSHTSLVLQPCRLSTSSSHLQRRRAAMPAATAVAPPSAAPPPQPAARPRGLSGPQSCPAAPRRPPGLRRRPDACLMQGSTEGDGRNPKGLVSQGQP